MHDAPSMKNLPETLETAGWDWRPCDEANFEADGFWVATAPDGRQWLSKFRGPERAYREIVFDRLAETLGWSCQRSAFIQLSRADAAATGHTVGEVHGVHSFFEEHPDSRCDDIHCGFEPLIGREIATVEDLAGIDIDHLLDWPRAEFAANLFGANEPSGRLITRDHRLVIIDSELMFSTGPWNIFDTHWARTRSGYEMATAICRDLAALTTADLDAALRATSLVDANTVRNVSARLRAARAYASAMGNEAHV